MGGPDNIISGFYDTRPWGSHGAIDIVVPEWTPVVACLPGTVVTTAWDKLAGWFIEIDHEGGYRSRYLHLNEFAVSPGQTVDVRELIGQSGNTGYSEGPHLHFALWNRSQVSPEGSWVTWAGFYQLDPLPFMESEVPVSPPPDPGQPLVVSQVTGTDISAYQGRPSFDWFKRIVAVGDRVFIIQAWGGKPGGGLGPNPECAYQLEMAWQAGADIGVYFIVPSKDKDVNEIIQEGRWAAGEWYERCKVAIDIEPGRSMPMERAVAAWEALKAQSHGHFKLGVYSSQHMWSLAFGSLEAAFPFAHEAWLWDANWHADSGVPVHNTPGIDSSWRPYGGWTKRAGLQYAGGVTTFGVITDWNLFDYERIGLMETAPPQPEPRKSTWREHQ